MALLIWFCAWFLSDDPNIFNGLATGQGNDEAWILTLVVCAVISARGGGSS